MAPKITSSKDPSPPGIKEASPRIHPIAKIPMTLNMLSLTPRKVPII